MNHRMAMLPLVLASASPRRRELLSFLGVSFSVIVSEFDEASLTYIKDPVEYVARAAASKAAEVASRTVEGIVLGVDTDVIAPDGTILGKPIDVADARRILWSLSGETHHVYSAVCALRVESGIVTQHGSRLVDAAVTFRILDDATIDAYLRSGEHADKAGAYGIQGRAMAFVERLDGDLSAVIGLPLTALTDLLGEFGVPLWECPSAVEKS